MEGCIKAQSDFQLKFGQNLEFYQQKKIIYAFWIGRYREPFDIKPVGDTRERCKGVGRGKVGNPSPRNRKNWCRKMVLFPKALFLVTNLKNKNKNSIFLKKFHQKISTFSQNFPTICVFRPNAQKINAGFVKFSVK